ncbi:MAG: hypothetical protein ACR2O0_04915 [Rhizobiaceae bacterium]
MKTSSIHLLNLIAISLLVLVMLEAPVHAQRPDTRSYGCGQVVSTIQQYGSIVWTTGPNTYDRIVSNRSYCKHGQVPEQKYAPTLDNPRCRVGYTCRERIFMR